MTQATRLFTLEEAERTLPLVRRIVADLVAEHPAWRAGVSRYEALSLAADPTAGETAEMVAVRADVAQRAERIDGYLHELEVIGCLFKGFESGLVDFPSLRNDEPVYLCWQLGESRIVAWHDMETGFAGRQPIDDAILSEAGA
jgi:hypothetical protein